MAQIYGNDKELLQSGLEELQGLNLVQEQILTACPESINTLFLLPMTVASDCCPTEIPDRNYLTYLLIQLYIINSLSFQVDGAPSSEHIAHQIPDFWTCVYHFFISCDLSQVNPKAVQVAAEVSGIVLEHMSQQ